MRSTVSFNRFAQSGLILHEGLVGPRPRAIQINVDDLVD